MIALVGSANVAFLDQSGHIVHVNRHWREFSRNNGGPEQWLGVDYLGVCRRVRGAERPLAQQVVQALEGVLERRCNEFQAEYPCDAPGCTRWYHMRLYPWPPTGAVAFHLDVSPGQDCERRLVRLQRDYGRLRAFLAQAVAGGRDPQWLSSVCLMLVEQLSLGAACFGRVDSTGCLEPLTWFARSGIEPADFRVPLVLNGWTRGRLHRAPGGLCYMSVQPDLILAWMPGTHDLSGEDLDLLVSVADVVRLTMDS